MARCLVAGAGGFVGGWLTKRLLENGCEVRAADIKRAEDWWQWNNKAEHHSQVDLRSWPACAAMCEDVDYVYQLAADMGGAGYVFTGDNDAAIMHNSAMINLNIVEACRQENVRRILWTSSACFAAGAPVMTSDGVLPIEDVCEDDRVLTHTGNFQRVTRTHKRMYRGPMIQVKSPGLPPVTVTPDHRFLDAEGRWTPSLIVATTSTVPLSQGSDTFYLGPVDRMVQGYHAVTEALAAGKLGNRGSGGVYSVGAKHGLASRTTLKIRNGGKLTGRCDPVGVESCKKDFDLGWLMGMYLAEGWIEMPSSPNGNRRITLALGDQEDHLLQKFIAILGEKFDIPQHRVISYNLKGQGGFKFHVSSERLAALMERCFYDDRGHHARHKTLREETLDSPPEFLAGLVVGWWEGDGCVSRRKDRAPRCVASSVSWRLAHTMRSVLHNFGIDTSMQVRLPTETKIADRIVRGRESYHIYIVGGQAGWQRFNEMRQGRVPDFNPVTRRLVAVPAVQSSRYVYNLDVEDDHSYIVQGMAVHNCIYPAYNQTNPDNPHCEEDSAYPAMCDSDYGWSKLFSERLYAAYMRNYGMEIRIARLHNVMGIHGSWNDGKEKAPAATCRKIAEIEDGGTVEVWGDGLQTRSFMDVADCVEGLVRLMASDYCEPINLGREEMVSINDLFQMVAEIAGKNIILRHVLTRPQGVRARTSDNTRLREVLKWEPQIGLREGLEKLYPWIQDQVKQWKTILPN